MLLQLDPAIPLVTPKGAGIAHLVIDYGIENDLYWVVFIDDTNECWTFSNKEIRACKNITIGRIGKVQLSENEKNKLSPIIAGAPLSIVQKYNYIIQENLARIKGEQADAP